MATSMTEELDRELEDREPPATRTPPGTAPPRTARTATYRVLCGTRLNRTVYVPVSRSRFPGFLGRFPRPGFLGFSLPVTNPHPGSSVRRSWHCGGHRHP